MKEDSIDLPGLVGRLQRGEKKAMREVFERYGDDCISFVRNYGSNVDRAIAEDIMMDAMLSFFERAKAGKASGVYNLRNYLLTTCRNLYLIQEKKRLQHLGKQDQLERYYYDYLKEYPDVLFEEAEERKWSSISRGLKSLGEQCQKLLKMFYYDRLSMMVIAAKLGFSGDKVAKTSKARCMKQLRKFVLTKDTEV